MSERAFFQAILDHPAEDGPRLVYADWLEEHGQAERAEFIRVQCELARLPPGDARSFALTLRERELLARHGKGWTGPVRHLAKRWHFRRGFVESVTLPATEFLRRADELFRLTPLLAVRLLGVTAGPLRDLADSPALGRLRGLDLSYNPTITIQDLEPLLQARRLAHVRSLSLCGTAACNREGILRLSRCENLRRLRELDVSQHRGTTAVSRRSLRRGMRAVFGRYGYLHYQQSPEWAELQAGSRQRDGGRLDAEAVAALGASPHLARLRRLALAGHRLGYGGPPDGEVAAAALHDPEALRRLYRPYEARREGTVAALSEALLGRLVVLDLSENCLGAEFAHRLVRSPNAARLRVLNLAANGIYGGREERILLDRARLPRLRVLDLSNNSYGGDASAFQRYRPEHDGLPRLLTCAARVPRLTCLKLDRCNLNNAALVALAGTPFLTQLVALSLNENGGPMDYNIKEKARERDPRRRFDEEGFRELVQSPLFGRLQVLSIQAGEQDGRLGPSWLGDAAMKLLAESPQTANLLALDLGNHKIGDAGLRALAESPHLANLRSLGLWRNHVTSPGAALLADPGRLPALRSLDLRSNKVSRNVCRALCERFGAGVRYGPGPTPEVRRETGAVEV